MLKFSQFGYNSLVATWLVPATIVAFVNNANAHGGESKFYAIVAMALVALFAYHGLAAWYSWGKTTTQAEAVRKVDSTAPADLAVVDYERLAAWKWVVCLGVGVLALYQAVVHFQMNSEFEGFASTFMLFYTGLDCVIAFFAFNQFWAIKSGQVVELTHKVSDTMLQR